MATPNISADPSAAFDGSDLGDILDDLDGIHAGIDLIRAGAAHIATSARTGDLTPRQTRLLLASLAGSPDATDVIGLIAALITELTSTDTNPSVAALPDEQAKTVRHHGEIAAHHLNDPTLREAPSKAVAALEHREGRCTP